ncbi:hypothetical protein OFY17_01225 [Marinomonas sp. C2222]|uniref:Flagellar protein FliT n=1 Tax=Marinomonas sargassi TaxID=2984494 RepID=A0ABT2YNM6_9GAMM|nr:hypothetical protein [Marinomonas sargassi]MCV2401493.1 hypothetical protein [Marinomonas sargassi]
MLDMSHLTELSDELEKSVTEKDIEKIQTLCEENDAFIHTITPLDNQFDNEKVKAFILVHQSAIQLMTEVHKEMQSKLFLTNKSRKSVNKYKGIKNAK